MKRLKFLLSGFFISPEFLSIIVAFGIGFSFADQAVIVGNLIRGNSEAGKYLSGFIATLSTSVFVLSSKIRSPQEKGTNKILYEWPYYNLLLDRVYLSFFYAIFSGAASIVLLIAGTILSAKWIFILSACALLTACSAALTVFLAHQKIREILEKYQK
jgi:hypothetical protein